jgi:hypothetical protein
VPHEISEQIEHAGHDSGHHGKFAQWIGITIAVLGVLMALCSAQVGEARTELIATMVKENGASQQYQTVSSKYRTLQAQLQQLHALMPDPKAMAETEAELKVLESQAKNPDTAQGIKAVRLEAKKILNTVTPTRSDVLRFTRLIRRHQKEAEGAREWAESYKDAIEVHEVTASRFERAQIAAEIGVIIASVGLLLSSHRRFALGAWITAIVLGVVTLSLAAGTYTVNHQKLHGAEEKIAASARHFAEMSTEKEDVAEDEKLMQEIERDIEKLTGGT